MKRRYCAFENPNDLTAEQFNPNEGRNPISDKDVMMLAFKSFQLQVYGCTGTVNGNRAFFAASAAKKKENELDPRDSKRAASRLKTVKDEIENAEI